MSSASARIVRVLDLLARSERPLTVTEIGRQLGIGKGSASRLLRDLARHGLLDRESSRGQFRLGLRLAQFARAALEQAELRVLAQGHLQRICERLEESAHLAIFRSGQIIYIDKVEAKSFVRTRTEIGDLAPPHCTASGKAILAWLPEAELSRWLRGQRLPAFTPKTLTARGALRAHLGQVRARGYAVDDEEYHRGVRCVAAPILDPSGQVIASIGISGLSGRLVGPAWRRAIAEVRKAAEEITASLSAAGNPPATRRPVKRAP
jgi:IclR family acetate operon transcriptional repressor